MSNFRLMAENVEAGRGAWTPEGHATDSLYYTYKPPLPLDGSNPDQTIDPAWVNRVRRGITAIRSLLREHGYTIESREKERFDAKLHTAVIEFQTARTAAGVYCPNDGFVGSITMMELLRPVMVSVGAEQKVHPRWMYGFTLTESGGDPGAQGEDNPTDSGLVQLNVEHGTYTLEQAYDPRTALRLWANRWKAALDKYDSDDRRLTIDCAIAQHRSPAAADLWFATGKGTGTIVEYVATVRSNAQDW